MKSLSYYLYRLKYNYPQLFNHKPVHLDLELTNMCNMKCPFCYRQSAGYKGPAENKMPVSKAIEVLTSAYKAGFRSVKFNWRGEPTLHQNLGQIAEMAREIGFLDTMINTNGSNILDEYELDYLTEVRVSIDTMIDSEYKKMRYPYKIDEIVYNLKETVEHWNPKKTRVIIQRRTTDNVECDKLFFNTLKHRIKNKKFYKYAKLSSKPVQQRTGKAYSGTYWERWIAGKLERRYCKQPSQRVVVGIDGIAHACCLNYNNNSGLVLGNVSLGFDKIINNYYRKTLISYLQRNKFVSDECRRCTSFTAYKEVK